MEEQARYIEYSDICAPPFRVRAAGSLDGTGLIINGNPVSKRRGFFHSSPATLEGDITLRIFTAGEGRFTGRDGRRSLGAGMVGIFLPESPGAVDSGFENPYSHSYCRFRGDYARYLCERIIQRYGDHLFLSEKYEAADHLLKEIGFVPRQTKVSSKDFVIGRAEILLARLLVLLQEDELRGGGPQLTRNALIDYLRERISHPVEIDRAAAFFNVSRRTLMRRSRELLGAPLLRYAEGMKVEWAGDLLHMGGYSVADVALRVGYEDPLYFSKVFKKRTGVSPRSWKSSSP